MTGPPKKPTNLKLLQGTYRGDHAPHEPKPEPVAPTIPAHLSPGARAEWNRISGELEALGLLTRLDRAALAAYCECWADWVDACRQCETLDGKDRKVTITAAGNVIENPYFSIKKRAAELMHKYIVEFGMTPASRTRIDASPLPAGRPGNPFATIRKTPPGTPQSNSNN